MAMVARLQINAKLRGMDTLLDIIQQSPIIPDVSADLPLFHRPERYR